MSSNAEAIERHSPTVRFCTFVKPYRALTESQAGRLAESLIDGWGSEEERILSGLGEDLRIESRTVDMERPTTREEGRDVLCVDYPRVRGTLGESPFDLRICVALCKSGLSSKIWIRLGIPRESQDEIISDLKHVASLTTRFRDAARRLGQLFWRRNRSRFMTVMERCKRDLELSMSVVATNDRQSEAVLARSAIVQVGDEGDFAPAESSIAREEFLKYIGRFGSSAAGKKHSNIDEFWAIAPSTVESADGSIYARSLTCRFTQLGDRLDVFGLGYEPDDPSQLSQVGALKLARWIGSRL